MLRVGRGLPTLVVAVVVGCAALVACSSPHPLREADWAKIERTRDSVAPPADYVLVREDRYGGDGCSWGPSCEGDPYSTVEYRAPNRASKASCRQLRDSLEERYPGAFRSITNDPYTCLRVGKLDGWDVRVTLFPRTGRLRVEAGTMQGDPDPYRYCDVGDPDPKYEPECFQ